MEQKKQKRNKEEIRESMIQSRTRRLDLTKYFGFIPHSVLKIKNPQINNSMLVSYQHEKLKSTSGEKTRRIMKGEVEFKERSVSSTMIGRGKKQVSMMPSQIVDFFVKFYAKPGWLYFDPFMGQGIQLQVANLRKVNYIGYDICEEYVTFINESIMTRINKKSEILEAHHADSKKINLKDNTVDFCFTSPPYWDIELYDENPEQLGIGKTYEEFIAGMEQVGIELYRIFKPSTKDDIRPCIINVGDIRKGGRMYPYNAHLINAFERAGWEFWDNWILHDSVAKTPKIFAVKKIGQKVAPKVHEYATVFIKRDKK